MTKKRKEKLTKQAKKYWSKSPHSSFEKDKFNNNFDDFLEDWLYHHSYAYMRTLGFERTKEGQYNDAPKVEIILAVLRYLESVTTSRLRILKQWKQDNPYYLWRVDPLAHTPLLIKTVENCIDLLLDLQQELITMRKEGGR
jgi:hypothetical protein